jgi:hypothetical protein
MLGMVTMILLLVVSCKGLYEYSKRNMKKNIVCVIVFFVFAFGENILIDSAINFALIMLIKDVIVFNSETINIYTYYKQFPKDIINLSKSIMVLSKNIYNNFNNKIHKTKNRRKS